MTGGSIRTTITRVCRCALILVAYAVVSPQAHAAPPAEEPAPSRTLSKGKGGTYSQRQQVIAGLPMERLTSQAQQRILSIAGSPTIYRRLPTQAIRCDRDMFLMLTRNPEVLVGIWDLMGITKVTCQRIGPYKLEAQDGTGTRCKVDLVYGDPNLHIFVADGGYDGKLAAKPIRGQAVFVLRSTYAKSADGGTTVTGSLDCFIQFDSLGADLIARTLSGLIGRSADNNYVETARFIAQVSQAAQRNPSALIELTSRIPQVGPQTKQRFVEVISTISQRYDTRVRTAARQPVPRQPAARQPSSR